jgi:acetate---CoA ligase (ADP-forming) subunit beta
MTTKDILGEAIKTGRENLGGGECRSIFNEAGIPMNASVFAKTRDEAAAAGDKMGYPVVMKIVSPQVVHKTEAGGVKLGIRGREELLTAWDEMMKQVRAHHADAHIDGVTIDEQLGGVELIVGSSRDPQFGPLIMFGLGGIFVEVYKDVTFRLVPITKGDALQMIEEVKGKPVYQGARGLPKASPEELASILVGVSKLVQENPAIRELDLNPLVVTPNGVRAIDARILVDVTAK